LNKNSSDLIVLLSHYVSTQSPLQTADITLKLVFLQQGQQAKIKSSDVLLTYSLIGESLWSGVSGTIIFVVEWAALNSTLSSESLQSDSICSKKPKKK
jgi:hypothetical protein